MKKVIAFLSLSLAAFLVVGTANAQMMRNGYGMPYGTASTTTTSTSQDAGVLAGQQVWASLQSKQTQCSQLTNTDFENLGDYFMDQMMGSGHQAMEQAVIVQSGQAGLDAMHIAMGERLSGCNLNVALPAGMMGYGSYYNGASSTPEQNNNPFFNMMGYGYGYENPLGWFLMLLFWALVVIGIIALVRRFGHGRHRGWHDHGHGAMDVLKERYAKGEIDKKEFEDKKRDLES